MRLRLGAVHGIIIIIMFKCYILPMTIASGHRCIVRRDGAAVNAAEIQSDCPRAFVHSASVRVIRNRETLFRTAMTHARVCRRLWVCECVSVCIHYISAPFCRTLCPLPRVRVHLAHDSLLSSHPLTIALPHRYTKFIVFTGYMYIIFVS